MVILIIVGISYGVVKSLDLWVGEIVWTLGVGFLKQGWIFFFEVCIGVLFAVFIVFVCCVIELGIVMMVGGNIKDCIRILVIVMVLEIGKGEFV